MPSIGVFGRLFYQTIQKIDIYLHKMNNFCTYLILFIFAA